MLKAKKYVGVVAMVLGFGENKKEKPKKERHEKERHVKVVGAQIPVQMYQLIEEHVLGKEYVSISDYIRALIRNDLKRRGLL